MNATIIDGKKVAADIRSQLSREIKKLNAQQCFPKLEVILVGDNPASKVYVGMKQKDCEKVGIFGQTTTLDKTVEEVELLELIDQFNKDDSVHGILVQLPLPNHISENKVIERISPNKDVDGFHPVNRGKLLAGQDAFVPCTPAGMQELLKSYDYDPKGKHIVIVGRSGIVGLPFAVLMMQKKAWANATVTVCHTGSGDLQPYTKTADILVAAAGRPKVITADMIKPGAVVIDVGVNRVDDPTFDRGYRLVGDVDFDAVSQVAGAITPVPGGVGPMTRAMLLKNTVTSAKKLCNLL